MPLSPINLSVALDSLVLSGHDPQRVMALAGLTAAQLVPTAPWLPDEALDRLMCAAAEVTGDAGWALWASTTLAVSRYGPQATLISQAPSLRHALLDMLTFAPLIVERPEVWVDEEAGVALMHMDPIACTPEGMRCRTEWLAALSVHLARRTGARPEGLLALGFAYPRPAHVDRYVAAFGADVQFDQARSWMRFPASLLDAPLPGHDVALYDALRGSLMQLLAARLPQHADVVQSTRQAVRQALPRVPEAAAVAASQGLSERSLRRQLAAVGASYAGLVQAVQRELAERLLREGRLSLKQVADAAGFASVSSFHRAFRRWHGQTPATWQVGQTEPVRPGGGGDVR